jgi:4'-phosphopantetheinyl transferase
LGDNDIHVWKTNLKRDDHFIQYLLKILSEDERIRAERFFQKKDQISFIVSRGMRRIILSYYLNEEPSEFRFEYSQYGKPSLATAEGSLNFNLSHSSGLAVYAITRHQKIGIDVERIISNFPCEETAERFFSQRENKELQEIEAGKPTEHAFFTCWTRKEAYIKARGEGLSMPLDQFDVSVSPHKPAKLLANRINSRDIARWNLMDIVLYPGFVSTLAVEGDSLRLSFWEI